MFPSVRRSTRRAAIMSVGLSKDARRSLVEVTAQQLLSKVIVGQDGVLRLLIRFAADVPRHSADSETPTGPSFPKPVQPSAGMPVDARLALYPNVAPSRIVRLSSRRNCAPTGRGHQGGSGKRMNSSFRPSSNAAHRAHMLPRVNRKIVRRDNLTFSGQPACDRSSGAPA